MSRSYKKHPWSGDKKGTIKKRVAWKIVRQYLKDNPDVLLRGSNYKKIYESWDICDFGELCSWPQYWEASKRLQNSWYYGINELDEEKEHKRWEKHFRRK